MVLPCPIQCVFHRRKEPRAGLGSAGDPVYIGGLILQDLFQEFFHGRSTDEGVFGVIAYLNFLDQGGGDTDLHPDSSPVTPAASFPGSVCVAPGTPGRVTGKVAAPDAAQKQHTKRQKGRDAQPQPSTQKLHTSLL
jgi:hypothetical protein